MCQKLSNYLSKMSVSNFQITLSGILELNKDQTEHMDRPKDFKARIITLVQS